MIDTHMTYLLSMFILITKRKQKQCHQKITRNQKMKVKMNNKTYDEIIQLVNAELQQTETITFSKLRQIDKKLRLPKGTSLDASGWKDILDFQFPAGN